MVVVAVVVDGGRSSFGCGYDSRWRYNYCRRGRFSNFERGRDLEVVVGDLVFVTVFQGRDSRVCCGRGWSSLVWLW